MVWTIPAKPPGVGSHEGNTTFNRMILKKVFIKKLTVGVFTIRNKAPFLGEHIQVY